MAITKEYVGAVAIIISPLIALWVGRIMQDRSDKKKEELGVLKNLIAYRHSKGSHEFLSALNKITLIFSRNKKITVLVKELWRSYANNEAPIVSKQKEVELVYEICKYMGYNTSEFEIDNFFVSGQPTTPSIQIIQKNAIPNNPNSTSSISNPDNKRTNSFTSNSTTLNI